MRRRKPRGQLVHARVVPPRRPILGGAGGGGLEPQRLSDALWRLHVGASRHRHGWPNQDQRGGRIEALRAPMCNQVCERVVQALAEKCPRGMAPLG
eukprot:4411061-Pleurochrysis_carterae.AAC.4